jgi:hypothetical protein
VGTSQANLTALAIVLGALGGCHRAPAPPEAIRPPLRAWPAPFPGPGVRVGPFQIATGAAASASRPDRCPDHVECHRIANNAADVAAAACDDQCDRCCPHRSADDCVLRECAPACQRCTDRDCRAVVCNDGWSGRCRQRCAAEMAGCVGCRGVWCGEGPARRACQADVDSHHQAVLGACDRDCPAAEKRADGTTVVTCGPDRVVASKPAGGCRLGQSPDCRCQCKAAIAGGCVAWDAVCLCD